MYFYICMIYIYICIFLYIFEDCKEKCKEKDGNDKHKSQDSGYLWSEAGEKIIGSFKRIRKVFFLKVDDKCRGINVIVIIYTYFIFIKYFIIFEGKST